jgi:septal ring factor EnvC (AmiA/AmiB activator)
MNNQFKNKMVEGGTTPRFNTGMFFCVPTNATPVALEECSSKELPDELAELATHTSKEVSEKVDSHKSNYEYENRLIQRQAEIIKTLEEQISEAEQELFEKDEEIERLENDLEEVCEELFLEVNLR